MGLLYVISISIEYHYGVLQLYVLCCYYLNVCRVSLSDAREFIPAIKQITNPTTQLILCVLPNTEKGLYDAIKKQCCIEQPVPSQCVTEAKLRNPKGLMSIVTKIAIQINCKLGGEAWALHIPVSLF